MWGAIYRYFVRFMIVNLALCISILSFEYNMNSEVLSHYSSIVILFKYKTLIEEYVFKSEFLEIYIWSFISINLYIFFGWFIRYFKYLNLPYALNIYRNVKQLEGHPKKFKAVHDLFKKVKKVNDGFILYYKNRVSISSEDYQNKKREILQYLGFDGEIHIDTWGKKGIKIHLYKMPEIIYPTYKEYIEGYISYGYKSDEKYSIPITNQTHLICVGESGSGKSNFMHHLLYSINANKRLIEKVKLIDLKGTELYRYKDVDYMYFIDDIIKVRDKLLELKNEMNKRFDEMKEKNEQLYQGKFYFVFIDEIGTIGTHPNKKLRDEIFALMVELFQKGRAARIIFFMFAQKIDSTNIPSNVLTNIPTKILMKTDSDFNINNTIGKKEDLEKITLLDPDSFPRGRAIVKNGFDSEKVLIQIPYIKFEKE